MKKDHLQSLPIFKYALNHAWYIDITNECKISFDPKHISRTIIQHLKQLQAAGRIVFAIHVYSEDEEMDDMHALVNSEKQYPSSLVNEIMSK